MLVSKPSDMRAIATNSDLHHLEWVFCSNSLSVDEVIDNLPDLRLFDREVQFVMCGGLYFIGWKFHVFWPNSHNAIVPYDYSFIQDPRNPLPQDLLTVALWDKKKKAACVFWTRDTSCEFERFE